jgi:hypothetical protein
LVVKTPVGGRFLFVGGETPPVDRRFLYFINGLMTGGSPLLSAFSDRPEGDSLSEKAVLFILGSGATRKLY